MAPDYETRYLMTALKAISRTVKTQEATTIGSIESAESPAPHLATVLSLGPGLYFSTTAGVSRFATPFPEGPGVLPAFEICAFSADHSPALLHYLSEFADFLVNEASAPEAKVIRVFDVYALDFGRTILLPRATIDVPEGGRVVLVEPLPLRAEDWLALEGAGSQARAAWCSQLGLGTIERWAEFLG